MRVLTVAFVATGMNAGVWMFPCGVFMTPVRPSPPALPFACPLAFLLACPAPCLPAVSSRREVTSKDRSAAPALVFP